MPTQVKIINQSTHPLPSPATLGSAGMDLRAFIQQPIQLKPLQRVLINTGLYIALPPGTEAQIRPRSGLAFKHGITILNAPGTIDADYRGEIKVLLINLSDLPFCINDGDRIGQLIVARYEQVKWIQTQNLSPTQRGEGGHGSREIGGRLRVKHACQAGRSLRPAPGRLPA